MNAVETAVQICRPCGFRERWISLTSFALLDVHRSVSSCSTYNVGCGLLGRQRIRGPGGDRGQWWIGKRREMEMGEAIGHCNPWQLIRSTDPRNPGVSGAIKYSLSGTPHGTLGKAFGEQFSWTTVSESLFPSFFKGNGIVLALELTGLVSTGWIKKQIPEDCYKLMFILVYNEASESLYEGRKGIHLLSIASTLFAGVFRRFSLHAKDVRVGIMTISGFVCYSL